MKVGDKLLVINIDKLSGHDVAPPLTLGETVELIQIIHDSAGHPHFHVGLTSNYNWVTSYETGEKLPNGDLIHWCHPSRFTLNS